MSQTKKKLPRGIRNNNPLNIRIGNNWRGEVSDPTDKQFEQFVSMEYGVRAAFIIIRNYIKKYKLNTIEKICSRWAPSSENNTSMYINAVVNMSGIPRRRELKFEDFEDMSNLFKGMCYAENGLIIKSSYIFDGYFLARAAFQVI